MATRDEQAIYGLKHDSRVLEEAARIMRRRSDKPAGISRALFCRTLMAEASQCRAEAAAIGSSGQPS